MKHSKATNFLFYFLKDNIINKQHQNAYKTQDYISVTIWNMKLLQPILATLLLQMQN